MIPFKLGKILVRSVLLYLASYNRFHPSFDSNCEKYPGNHVRSLPVGGHSPAPCAPTVYHTASYTPSAFRWEFVTTLDYEWNVIRGRQPYRWTIWVRTYRFL